MSFQNEIRLIGNLTSDPAMYERVARIRIASNTKVGDKKETLFIDVKMFGHNIEEVTNHELKKGDKVMVFGRLAIEEYESTKTGENKKDAVVYCNNFVKLSKIEKSDGGNLF